ncbi:MAG: phosphatase PAP2 family protein [Pseudoxanthomonas sp.]
MRQARRWPAYGLASSYWARHLWMPMSVFAMLSLLLMAMGGDQWLADRLFAMQGNAWALQSSHIVQDVLHAGGRLASKSGWYIVLTMLLASLCVNRLQRWRMPLAYLLVSTLLATALVGAMKRWTHMDCPWDLLRYGGDKAYYGLFSRLPAGMRAGSCFPAGHASAGYAWVALYFFFDRAWPRLRRWGLGIGLALGLVFGIAQQLRGAHFLSHDLWSLAISWTVALILSRIMLRPNPYAPAGLARA